MVGCWVWSGLLIREIGRERKLIDSFPHLSFEEKKWYHSDYFYVPIIILTVLMPYLSVAILLFTRSELKIFSKTISFGKTAKWILASTFIFIYVASISSGFFVKSELKDEIVQLINEKDYSVALEKAKEFDEIYSVESHKVSKDEIVVSRELIEDLQKLKNIKSDTFSLGDMEEDINKLTDDEIKLLLEGKSNKVFLVNKQLNKEYVKQLSLQFNEEVSDVNKIYLLDDLYPKYQSNQDINALKNQSYYLIDYLNKVYNNRITVFLNGDGEKLLKNKYKEYLAEQKRIDEQRLAEERKAEQERKAEERRIKAQKKSEGVRVGMTEQDVLDSSWGRPDDINRTVTSYGTSEQWVYDRGGFNYNFLYFDDGILTSIQN
jgi:hypothetical protein